MIQGIMSELKVYIDKKELSTERSRKLKDHAPDGNVAWGYHGSGPSLLALALLLHFGATDYEGLTWYQEFKRDVISELPENDFLMKDERVIEWLESRRLFAKELESGDNVLE